MMAIVNGQYRNIRSAIVGTGELRLSDNCKQFAKTKLEWLGMSELQRNNHYTKLRKYVNRDGRIISSTDGQTQVLGPTTNGKKPGQRKRKVNARTVTVDKRPKL